MTLLASLNMDQMTFLLLSFCFYSPTNKNNHDVVQSRKGWITLMSAFVILTENGTGGGTRDLLLILWIIAIALILIGAIIALCTLYYQRKVQPPNNDRVAGE